MQYRITFEVVKDSRTKSGKCRICGKRCTRSRTEEGTLNPWNRNPDGTVRSYEEVLATLRNRLAVWMKEPIAHARCEEQARGIDPAPSGD